VKSSELDAIEKRALAASPGPWKAYVEGRDHWGGDNFIMVGGDSDEDMYVSRTANGNGTEPASIDDLDFIACARQDVVALLREVRALRARLGEG